MTRQKHIMCASLWTGNPMDNAYLSTCLCQTAEYGYGYRARSIAGVKVNNKRSVTDLGCRFCRDNTQESQEHLEECSGSVFERRGLDLSDWRGLVAFWKRMTAKIAAGTLEGPLT